MYEYFALFIIIGFSGCNYSHPENPKSVSGHSIFVDYNTEETIPVSELIEDIRYIPLDSNKLIHEGGVIKRVLIQNKRIVILQSGAACGCSELILFDEFGRYIKTVDGYHKGSDGFPWAMDVTYDISRDRYVVLSRNPGRIVEIDTDGAVVGEKLLPFDGVYMDLYYFGDKFLFFSDNASVGQPLKRNILITDSQFTPIDEFDPINHIRQRGHSIDKDKLNFNYATNTFIYHPSPILDSIYTIDANGDFQVFGKVFKSHNLSDAEMKVIESSESPTFTLLFETEGVYEKTSIIREIHRAGEYLLIPTIFRDEIYYTFYSTESRNSVTVKLQNETIFRWPVSTSQLGFFIRISAFNFMDLVESELDSMKVSNNQFYREMRDLYGRTKPSDNAIIALFDFNESTIQNYLTQASAGKKVN